MKSSLFALVGLFLALEPLSFAQQNSAATSVVDQSPGSLAANQSSSGLLTPPPDNAPALEPVPPAAGSTPPSPAPAKPSEAPKTESAPRLSPREIKRIEQQEILRRQELMYRANHALATAEKAEIAQDYPLARQNYLFSAEAFGSISRSTESYARAAEGLTRVNFQLYDSALKKGDTVRAKQLIDEVVKYNPNNGLANEKLVAINKALADPNDTTLLGNPAVTPGFVKKVNEIEQLFAEAEQFRRTGQWDEAQARLKKILGIDPYNIAATKELTKINSEKDQYSEKAYLQTREERLRQVEEKWYEPIINRDETTSAQESQQPLLRTTTFDIDEKLKSIFISLDFNNATIDEATNFLSLESKRLDDPSHKGVNFVIQPEALTSAKPVTLTLNNVPLGEALRYVCQLAGVKYKVQDYAISIVPFTQSTEDFISRTFIVQPNFVVPPSTTTVIESATGALGGQGAARPVAPVTPLPGSTDEDAGDTVRAALIAKGVKFPPGASAVYTRTTQQLTVVDTADQMELLEELVNAGQAPTLMVRVATKFVEINQNDLDDMSVNTAFNFFNINGGQTPTQVGSDHIANTTIFNTALPGARGFSPDSIDNLIQPSTLNYNSLFFRGNLTGLQYNIVIDALSQKKSFDLMTSPAVLTKSGEQGVLEAVRVFPYPIAFDAPQLISQTNNNNNNGGGNGFNGIQAPTVIATTPTDFKRRNIGVRLVIKPQVAADNKIIDLSLFPEVTDFEGFINYGSPIFVGNPDGSQSLLSENVINQPVFNTRRINTKVQIRDGSTVVLGGLIREDTQNADEKVPFFGDIPLIGRLFQSKATTNTKKNLLIFVTANIYRNDGELLNPPEEVNAASVLTSHATLPSTPNP